MPTLDERIAAAEQRERDAHEKLKALRKKKRERDERERREAERKARLAEQEEALSILRWLKANDIDKMPSLPVNAYEFITSLMNCGVDESADTNAYGENLESRFRHRLRTMTG